MKRTIFPAMTIASLSRRLRKLKSVGFYLILFCPLAFLGSFLILNMKPNSNSSKTVAENANHEHEFPGYKIAPDSQTANHDSETKFGSNRSPSTEEDLGSRNPRKKDWMDEKQFQSDRLRRGPGEHGVPVQLPRDNATMTKEDELYRVNGYNALTSDEISVNRSLPDARSDACKRKKYLRDLPRTSVIMPFHDEHWTVVLRSVWSILNRTPKELLQEVVIVDDNSTKDFLLEPLEEYRREHWNGMVKLVRTGRREGLIRARQIGARAATGEVFITLGAFHKLQPIALDSKTVTCPFIDGISCDGFGYGVTYGGSRGGFDWEFHYKQFPLRPGDQENDSANFNSPVMQGGYFAVNAKWFWDMGGYDEGLDIWGGEQYELSFKVWQCHGRVIDVPCSHVGHIYRCKYQPFPNPNVGDFIARNYKRVAEVWMDEYKEYLYENIKHLPKTDCGDITMQKAVRQKLKCKSFKWYMNEVLPDQDQYFPAILPPDGAFGNIKSMAFYSNPPQCIDANSMSSDETMILYECNEHPPQQFRHTWFRDVRNEWKGSCFVGGAPAQPLRFMPCNGMGGGQAFRYDADRKQIRTQWGDICVDCESETKKVMLNKCDDTAITQQWEFTNVNRTQLEYWETHPRKTYG